MGTGGLKPTSNNDITQYVTFYNTTGIIEKDKGIYFCPLLPKVTTGPQAHVEVSAIWKSKFEAVASHTSDYSSIAISKWSPRDRSLVVKGLPDDFRVVSVLGRAFNYMILSRNVDRSSAFASYYDGFFITDVQQVGIGSVRVTLEPDNFTNIFYLHNNKQRIQYGEATADEPYIDVFNEKLKNCYVNRQHYNRYRKALAIEGTGWVEQNLDIFSNIEESFKYRRQYRDYKEMLNYGDMLHDSEKEEIKNTASWSDLSPTTRKHCIELCLAFVNITLNTNHILLSEKLQSNRFLKPFVNLPNVREAIQEQLVTITYPILITPTFLKKYERSISSISFTTSFEREQAGNYYPLAGPTFNMFALNKILSIDSVYAQYIVSAYISRENKLIDFIEVSETSSSVYDLFFKETIGDMRIAYLLTHLNTKELTTEELGKVIDNTYFYTETDGPNDDIAITFPTLESGLFFTSAFIVKRNPIGFNLDLRESNKTKEDIKNNFTDPVITFNPYSFYTISYLGRIEVPLNKLNYYENAKSIKCELTVVASDVFKYSFIPTYRIHNKEYKMYSESLEQTVSNNITIVSSALNEYLVANQVQMHNQYAVNDWEHGHGMLQAGIGTVGAVVKGLATAPITGPFGAIAGGVSGITNLINEGISWAKDKGEIAMNQKAKLADVGNLPSNLKQVGTDIHIDLATNELGLYLNHYTIDELSKNSICKYLERFGYVVNIYDDLHVNDRVGWNYVQLISFDYDGTFTTEEEDSVRQILQTGVTLLHETTVLHDKTKHNYETILDE